MEGARAARGWVTHDQCLSIGQAPSPGVVYIIDERILVKLSFQYPVTNVPDSDAKLYRNDSLCNFEILRKEANIY